ncbi:peptidase M28, partial [Salinimicrobium sp. CDJ15-91]|nr:peptidase M28 [Salinimicrobium oceani]
MSKSFQAFIAVLILISGVVWSFYNTRPQVDLSREIPPHQFSTARALEHVKSLAKEPHYVGSTAHRYARNYIVSQLEAMDLLVETQEGYTLNKIGILTRPQNIMTRIQGSGTGKALL